MAPLTRAAFVRRRTHFLCGFITFAFLTLGGSAATRTNPTPSQLEFFELRIRPHLANHCYSCHGATKQDGGLRLDFRDALLKGGTSGPGLAPGDPQSSRLVQRIQEGHPDLTLTKHTPKIPAASVADIIRWIKDGAPDPRNTPATPEVAGGANWQRLFNERRAWWSFQPIQKTSPPQVKDETWSEHPVDRFILAGLEQQQIRPAPTASRNTWLRRVHFAITGLPPTPEELERFLEDQAPGAQARVVDRLLSSPHFGERWARHWMDLMRFAETYGHEQDFNIPSAWRYRDYLIRAFNADVPYDQFVTEQIAGDLLKNPRSNAGTGGDESILGTGWWFLHQATHAPVDPPLDEADRIDNQIDVLSKTFLGLTVACARCHDHKFDPISSRDYYSLSAFLRGSRQDIAFVDPDGSLVPGVYSLREAHVYETPKLVGSLKQLLARNEPRIAVYLTAAHEVLHGATQRVDAVVATNTVRSSQNNTNAPQRRLARPIPAVATEQNVDPVVLERWVTELETPAARKPNHPLQPWLAAVARERGAPPEKASPPAPQPAQTAPSSFETFPFPDLRGWFPSGEAFKTRLGASANWRAEGSHIAFFPVGAAHSGTLAPELAGTLRSPTFTITHPNIFLRLAGQSGRVKLIISRYGLREFNPLLFEQTQFDVNTDGQFVWHSITSGLERHMGRPAYFEIIDRGPGYVAIDKIVFSKGTQPPVDPAWLLISTNLPPSECAKLLEKNAHEALGDWLKSAPEENSMALVAWLSEKRLIDWGESSPLIERIAQRIGQTSKKLPTPLAVLAMADGSPEPTHLFLRGDPKMRGPMVQRRFLEALSGPSVPSTTQGSGRLELAAAMLAENNPFLSRVIVNRIWAHLFGRGIVATVDNFGSMGQRPTHPELLDYLARTFREEGGSMKRLIRTLCLSRTFAMSSSPNDLDAEARDPENRLLHRMPLRRLEGEAIRDNLLAVSGALNPTQFGPSVATYFTPFMGDHMWVRSASGPMDGERRRSIYLETRRNFLSPWMITFDLPVPDTTVGQRNSSNLPGQALALMNDPLVHQEAAIWAKESLRQTSLTEAERVKSLFIQALARAPQPTELERMLDFLKSQASVRHLSSEAARRDPDLWAEACHLMFMMKEFIYVP